VPSTVARGPAHPLAEGRERQPVLAVLALVPAGAEADLDPAPRDHVNRGGDLGEQRGVAEGVRRHHEPAPDAPGLDEERGEQRPALVLRARRVVLVHQVVVDPGGVEAEAVGLEPRLAHLGVRALHLRHLDSEPQPPPHPCPTPSATAHSRRRILNDADSLA
jgi:hypothetical protein